MTVDDPAFSRLPVVPVVPPTTAEEVPRAVEQLLNAAIEARASDLHLRPTTQGLEIAWRLDGVLSRLALWPATYAANVVARLKVLAKLLTYKTEHPQEGRLELGLPGLELRLSTFPTLHGEKGVVRLFVGSGRFHTLDELAMPDDLTTPLRSLLRQTSGVFVIAGPAGSGKTTTAYACLREILSHSEQMRSVVTLEDPIEAELCGAAQTQVNRPPDFTYSLGLRSLLRQDPDVIFVGEIRDRETAATAFQAGLAGHLVITTFHAGSAAEGAVRLIDLGVEPYLLRAGLRGVLCQRLVRRRCECQASEPVEPVELRHTGCPRCWGTGYRGRLVIAELFQVHSVVDLPEDTVQLSAWQAAATRQKMVNLEHRGTAAITAGLTTPAEIERVLGQRFLEAN